MLAEQMEVSVQQFFLVKEVSKEKERRIEGPEGKEGKRRIHCQEPLAGASQIT